MVAGCLGQRTCPRSCCAAHQPRAPAASRLRGPPDAAAARSERPGARTQPLLPRASPLLSTMERARLRPPARARKGGEPNDRSAQDASARWRRRRSCSWGPARRPGSSHPAGPGRLGATTPGNSRDILEWAEGLPWDCSERGNEFAHTFSFPIFPGVLPYTLLVTQHFPPLCLLRIPRRSSPQGLYSPKPSFFPSETTAHLGPVHWPPPLPAFTKLLSSEENIGLVSS